MESTFIAKGIETNEEELPPLPLPKLDETLQKYLDSCRPVLTAEEFQRTEAIVNKFKKTNGKMLHYTLVDRSITKRNWLEEWWLDAYLQYRGSLAYGNFFGGAELEFWPSEEGTQLERSALKLHIIMKFWSLLKEEKFAQQVDGNGKLFSMHQFRNMFNTSRIPKLGKDVLYRGFKTHAEGYSPTHIIVFYRHRMYKMQTVDEETGNIYTPAHFYKMLSDITWNEEYGVGVSSLTELDRDKWCDAREYLMNLSPENAKFVNDVESALFCFALSEHSAKTRTRWLKPGVNNCCGDRWSDKSFCYSVSKDGLFTCHNDHTPFDGMVFVTLMAYTAAVLFDWKGKWDGSWQIENIEVEPLVEMVFTLDDKLKTLVEEGKSIAKKVENDLDIQVISVKNFGKKEVRNLKIHPDAFVQICLQLAYMTKYGKPAPTYETATTRIFYHGRTETCRTCTVETVAFCKAMINDSPKKKQCFIKAYQKLMWLMAECKAGRGCDRHLLGLASAADENGDDIPELFTDLSFEKSGGNGNFILSTSFTGYGQSIGAVTPMRADGYGTFYRINNKEFTFAITSWKSCHSTDSAAFGGYITNALLDVYDLISEQSCKL